MVSKIPTRLLLFQTATGSQSAVKVSVCCQRCYTAPPQSPSVKQSGSIGSPSPEKVISKAVHQHELGLKPDIHRHSVVDRVVRVVHAGERAAAMMYIGQTVARGRSSIVEDIKKKRRLKQENVKFFEEEIRRNRVRPSLLLPLWDAAGFVIGVGSTLLRADLASKCTSALHEAVSDHYNSQLRELLAEEVGNEQLLEGISKCRDGLERDESESREGETDIDEEPTIHVLTQSVKAGCKLAAELAEQV